MSTHTKDVESNVKNLRKQVSEIERDIRNIREVEESLPQWQAEVDRIKGTADIKNDAALDELSRARERVRLLEDLRMSNPPRLEKPARLVIDRITSLNDSLRAAARDEREQIILEATAALAPFAGTRLVDSLYGAKVNPAREIAATLPILENVPSEPLQTPSADNIEHRGFLQFAESVLMAAREALSVADSWLKAGGKFAQKFQ